MKPMFSSVSHGLSTVVDAVVLPWFGASDVPVTWEPEVQEAVKRKEFIGEVGQIVEAFPSGSPRTFVVAMGSKGDSSLAASRRAMAALARRLSQARVSGVLLDFGDAGFAEGQVAGECIGLLGWKLTNYKGRGTPQKELADLRVCGLGEEFDKGLAKGIALATSANFARTLVATPPNDATPDWMAAQAETLQQYGLKVDVVRDQGLVDKRMTGLINVGKASVNKPCFVRIEYRPEGVKGKPVILLGKTITYDTGGLAIKSREGMKGMKGDKAGGCAVIGAMHAVATLIKPSFPVVGLLVAAENSIGDNAFRMDDVLEFRNGVTVEVTNTDAEGRLVLADGLAWACEKESPRCIVDMATLTGGVVIALGKVFAGLFSNDEALALQLERAGSESGERLWRLPLDAEYDDVLRSEVADIVNSAASKGAHPVMGATFLSNFVEKGVPWAHIDIAGTSDSDSDKGLFVVGPTGFGVRLAARFLELLKA